MAWVIQITQQMNGFSLRNVLSRHEGMAPSLEQPGDTQCAN
jgi:hypothetical protein